MSTIGRVHPLVRDAYMNAVIRRERSITSAWIFMCAAVLALGLAGIDVGNIGMAIVLCTSIGRYWRLDQMLDEKAIH